MEKERSSGTVKASDNVVMEDVDNAEGIKIQRLIVEEDGSRYIRMRRFTIEPEGWMVLHKHENTEHVQYFLKGEVILTMDGDEYRVQKGDAVFIPSGVSHKYENKGEKSAQFLCIVKRGEIETEILD